MPSPRFITRFIPALLALALVLAACSGAGSGAGAGAASPAATVAPAPATAAPPASAAAGGGGYDYGKTEDTSSPAAGGGSSGGGSAVTIQGFAFGPTSITVAAGTTVTWTNQDTTSHTVTADDGSFDSKPLASGATFSQAFATAGTFTYHCAIHPSMKATVVVQ